MKKFLPILAFSFALTVTELSAHCQMPCGIYHDAMVFDQIDQYVETMVKGFTYLNDNKFSTPQERCEFIRWIGSKEEASDEVANIICFYFIQQKLKPDDPMSLDPLKSAHRLLFNLVMIKQTVDMKWVSAFDSEWEKFKLFFHVQGYQCAVEKKTLREWEAKRDKAIQDGTFKKSEEIDEVDHDAMHEQGVEHTH